MRSSQCVFAVGTSLALLALQTNAYLSAAPKVEGDPEIAAAIVDLMTTTEAALVQGETRFRHTNWAMHSGEFVAAGTYVWSPAGDYFDGEIVRTGEYRRSKEKDVESTQFAWSWTRGEEWHHTPDPGLMYRKVHPMPETTPTRHILMFSPRPWLDAFYFSRDRVIPLSSFCVPPGDASEFSVRAGDDQRITVEVAWPNGYRASIVADPAQGGHIIEYTGRPASADQHWERGEFRWAQAAGAIWYPTYIEHETCSHGDWDQPLSRLTTELSEFTPNPVAPKSKLPFSSRKLPVGTRVIASTPDGVQQYTVGGATGEQLIFQRQLNEAADKSRSQGFAHPERGDADD